MARKPQPPESTAERHYTVQDFRCVVVAVRDDRKVADLLRWLLEISRKKRREAA